MNQAWTQDHLHTKKKHKINKENTEEVETVKGY